MKKISLITIFDNPNFGTYLQALALSLVLQKQGCKVEIVRYLRPVWHNPPAIKKRLRSFESLWEMWKIYLGDKKTKQRKECRKFVSRHIAMTGLYYTFEELTKKTPIADIYLTGSDQVWNSIHNHGLDKSFYLAYAPLGKPKFAYAASFGMQSIPLEYQEETKKLLSQYVAISVREQSNVDLLRTIGIDSELVLDPTLLLDATTWRRYAKPMKFSERYVLVYSVESEIRDNIVGEIARFVADQKGLKVFEVSYLGEEKSIPYCDKHFYYSTPQEFLALIDNASFVVGSSFHLTAFAINFNKPFLSVTPDRFTSRIDNLLSLTDLLDRKVSNKEEAYKAYYTECDFKKANNIIKREQEHSLLFIKKIVNI